LLLLFVAMQFDLAVAPTTLSDPPPVEVGVGYSDMADLARANERLRSSLDASQKRVSELHDALDAQRKTTQEVLNKMKDLERRLGDYDSDPEPRSWFADLLRRRKPRAAKASIEMTGCHSVSCCLSLLSGWALEVGRFFLTGIWGFFWDPVGWWQGAKESLTAVVASQFQVVSRVIGILLLGIYINVIAWVLRRIHSVGAGVRRLWRGFWRLPAVDLAVVVLQWGAGRLLAGRTDPRPDGTAQLLKKVEELTRLVKQQQGQPSPAPQRPPPATPVTRGGRQQKPCPNCGKAGHTLIECRKPKRCLRCQSAKHLAKDCPQVQAIGDRKAVGRTQLDPSPVVELADFQGEGDVASLVEDLCREVETEVRAAEGSRAPVLHVRAGIGSSRELVLVDTGSSVNVLPLSFAEAQGLELSTDADEAGMRLRAFNGTSSEVAGTTLVPVTVGRWKATVPFLVTDACSSIIIGMPGLRDLDVKVDPALRRLEDREGHLVYCQRADISAPAYSLELTSKN